jgi:hypothetical protein
MKQVGYHLTYPSGVINLIARAPDSYELRECQIKPVFTVEITDDVLARFTRVFLRRPLPRGTRLETDLRAALQAALSGEPIVVADLEIKIGPAGGETIVDSEGGDND